MNNIHYCHDVFNFPQKSDILLHPVGTLPWALGTGAPTGRPELRDIEGRGLQCQETRISCWEVLLNCLTTESM